jgi:hypothetical protein
VTAEISARPGSLEQDALLPDPMRRLRGSSDRFVTEHRHGDCRLIRRDMTPLDVDLRNSLLHDMILQADVLRELSHA